MRSGRGRSAAIAAAAAIANRSGTRKINTPIVPGNKSKCVVRLEKVPKKDEEINRNKTPNISVISKKRSISSTSTPTPPPIKKGKKSEQITKKEEKPVEKNEDLSKYTLATARTRRAPKPNPKYADSDIVTKFVKSEKILKSDDESIRDFDDSTDDYEIDSGDVKEFNESEDEFEKIFARKSKSPLNKSRGKEQKLEKVIMEKRKTNINLEANISKRSNTSDLEAQKPIVKSSEALDKHRQSLLRPLMKSVHESEKQKSSKPIQILERRKENTSGTKAPTPIAIKRSVERKEDDLEVTQSNVTLTTDDFETMPTFTIVNIHDIMNKKTDDILKIDKTSVKEKQQITQQTLVNKTKKLNTLQQNRNLNKQSPVILNNNLTKSLLKSTNASKPTNAPPRILNSGLGKKTRPVSPIVTHKEIGKPRPTVCVAPQQRQLKEAMNKNNLLSKDVNNKTLQQNVPKRKLPSERITLTTDEEGRVIRKITCFENWSVIKIPSLKISDDVQPKNTFNIPLNELGNRVKEIDLLPNWNYKVTLQKIPPEVYNRPNHIAYKGEINNPNISEEDKIKFQPINVTFRRFNTKSSALEQNRLPFDRALIFKNRTYFINIEGKNVRLIGAPAIINSIEDIKTLIEIVDELELASPHIELATI